MAITVFLSRSRGLLNRGPGDPASLRHVPHSSIFSPIATAQSGGWGPTLLGAGFLYRILPATDWTSCALSYIIVWRPPSSCGRYKSHSFNPSSVKVIFWYSSTGCTCYLHWCISYFNSPAGSEVNIQKISYLATPISVYFRVTFMYQFSLSERLLCWLEVLSLIIFIIFILSR